MEAIRRERLLKYKLGNAKLGVEVQKLRAQVGNIEAFKQEVIAANTLVKVQLLAIPYRLNERLASETNPAEVARVLTQAITAALNDLAYSREQPVDSCPTCGQSQNGE
jgi:hypothetical protein